MKICARCDRVIKGTPLKWNHIAASGGGIDVYVCPTPCRPSPPRQTAPIGRRY
ncbi:hypothetical protein BX257_2999 [Streptomyces sp. 3212.3]|nr:hypothetical protein BX257_2999 [Streptomyces sp. 3212.3]